MDRLRLEQRGKVTYPDHIGRTAPKGVFKEVISAVRCLGDPVNGKYVTKRVSPKGKEWNVYEKEQPSKRRDRRAAFRDADRKARAAERGLAGLKQPD